ncbi:hypothetical protein M7I_2554 [Glarea lozoyensis 74030]|uniref:Uncharacterized protein n=1 Tax=Glarea lozoyensis (strain ATCC 74030 / MF5533) TaxID=1104152 RepID=H0EJ31_GLAL7|nr:hypothetical protein M7I_2554 [Glarea lozoyensis 74030]
MASMGACSLLKAFGRNWCSCVFGVDVFGVEGCDCTPREELPYRLLLLGA